MLDTPGPRQGGRSLADPEVCRTSRPTAQSFAARAALGGARLLRRGAAALAPDPAPEPARQHQGVPGPGRASREVALRARTLGEPTSRGEAALLASVHAVEAEPPLLAASRFLSVLRARLRPRRPVEGRLPNGARRAHSGGELERAAALAREEFGLAHAPDPLSPRRASLRRFRMLRHELSQGRQLIHDPNGWKSDLFMPFATVKARVASGLRG